MDSSSARAAGAPPAIGAGAKAAPAQSEASGGRMAGLRLLGVLCAAVAVALALSAAVCLLPENRYQRWQLMDSSLDGRLRWIYERIHDDPRPIDVAILGASRAQLGLGAAAIEQQLAEHGKHANVVNFSLEGSGRNIQWAILDEIYKAKSPKAIVLEVDQQPFPVGHFAFKYVAPADAIVLPPTPFLHNYLYDLAYLPIRKVRLFGANLFPGLFGLTKQFDPELYARRRTDYTTSFPGEFGKIVDMEHAVPRAVLLAEPREPLPQTSLVRAISRINGGEDHLYLRKIAEAAKAHGTKLIFVYLPMFNNSGTISDVDFLKSYGLVVDNGDLAQRDELYENWSHLNHAGSVTASARVADALNGLGL